LRKGRRSAKRVLASTSVLYVNTVNAYSCETQLPFLVPTWLVKVTPLHSLKVLPIRLCQLGSYSIHSDLFPLSFCCVCKLLEFLLNTFILRLPFVQITQLRILP
jgi:hypothetical protein